MSVATSHGILAMSINLTRKGLWELKLALKWGWGVEGWGWYLGIFSEEI